MKKIIYALLIVILSSQIVLASDDKESSSFEASIMRAQKTETKSKTTYYKNSAGKTLWLVRVTGTFTYGNGLSKCISSKPYASSNSAHWSISNVKGGKSGNTAIASATGKYIVNGKVIETKNKSVRLSCSSTGVFS